MRRMMGRRLSAGRAALVVACLALVAALGGSSIAEVATKALSKKEKKQTRKIATIKANQAIDQRAPGLSVKHASTAGAAASAANANRVDGVSAAKPFDQASESSSDRVLATIGNVQFKHFCSSGINQTILEVRTTNGASAVYYRSGAADPVPFGGTDVAVDSVAANGIKTVPFTINTEEGTPTVITGTLTLRHNSTLGVCRIYGTLLGG